MKILKCKMSIELKSDFESWGVIGCHQSKKCLKDGGLTITPSILRISIGISLTAIFKKTFLFFMA